MTIFTRILLATTVPMLLAFAFLLVVAHIVVYDNSIQYANRAMSLMAGQSTERIHDKLANVASLLAVTSASMAETDFSSGGAKRLTDEKLVALLAANPSNYCAWFAFEPGAFPEGGRYYKTVIRTESGPRVIPDLTNAALDDAGKSPWYNQPLASGRPYLDFVSTYDYGLGEGSITAGTMTYPILRGGKVIGCVGLDLKYDDIFLDDDPRATPDQELLLLSPDGTVLYANAPRYTGKNILTDSPPSADLFAKALRDEAPLAREVGASPLRGVPSMAYLHPIRIDPSEQVVYLYSGVPLSFLHTPAYLSVKAIALVGLGGLLLLPFGVFASTRGIARPIRRLTVDFNRIADNDDIGERRETPPCNVVELGALQLAQRKMLEQLTILHELRMKAAESVIEKEKMIAASQAKSRFFAHMSHEIRTPMNAVMGIAEILLQGGDLNAEQERYVRDIRSSSESLLTIINDVLDLSRLEAGKMRINQADFNLSRLLGEVSSLAGHLAFRKGLAFTYGEDGDIPRYVLGDAARLRQVLTNLVANAVKFTETGSISLRVEPRGALIRFRVADSGVGIAEKDKADLFKPFERVVSNEGGVVQGTGLGLSIVANLVELMGGTIDVESAPGKGSAFSVTLPLARGAPTRTHLAKQGDTKLLYDRSVKVLVVDDNALNRTVASGLLQKLHGIDCHLAASGEEALSMLGSVDYHLIFMDHMMPGMNGDEAARAIRAMGGKYGEAKLPIVALTANVLGQAKDLFFDAGMNDFLAKPIQKDELRAILRRWLPEEKILRRREGKGAGETPVGRAEPA